VNGGPRLYCVNGSVTIQSSGVELIELHDDLLERSKEEEWFEGVVVPAG
jgi:hypothetical protein